MKSLYPDITPFHHFYLQTDSGHSVYVEQSGNPQGAAVIFLHGGPGSGTKPHHRRFFNAQKYHIILMDQRGCGKSRPFGELKNNTTQHLIADMEQIRIQLQIKKWHLFGGSWGSTLALLYAQQHSEKVLSMVIRGVFLARQQDLNWLCKDGVNHIYPEKWQQLLDTLPQQTEADIIETLYNAIFCQHELLKRRVAKAWNDWAGQVTLMSDFQADEASQYVDQETLKQTQLELHYAKNNYFIAENQVLNHVATLKHIPTVIIHGRRDLVCPMEAGVSLYKKLPHAQFIALPDSGHVASDEGMINALVTATDHLINGYFL